jgi:hypothetical protein
MKNTRFASILGSSVVACALMIGSLVSTQSASAQSSETIAEVTIPFDFQTPLQILPAGKYRVFRDSSNLLRLQGPGSKGGFVVTHEAIKRQASNNGAIVFDRYGDKYYLHQIWTAGQTTGFECPKGRAEKARMVAMNNEAPTTVELALNSAPRQ